MIEINAREARRQAARLARCAPDLAAALTTIAEQCGPYATRGPALDYASIGNIARAALVAAGAWPAPGTDLFTQERDDARRCANNFCFRAEQEQEPTE